MRVTNLGMGVVEVVPTRHSDARGFFSETFQRETFARAGIDFDWMQDNHSYSAEKHTLRGLHFQMAPAAQDKLIRVLSGSVYDVAVDLRAGSDTYGRWVARVLSATDFNQLLIPKGFAHGFLTLEPRVEVLYKVTAPYAPGCDRTVRWDDPEIGIAWPLDGNTPVLSDKDAAAPMLRQIAAAIVF